MPPSFFTDIFYIHRVKKLIHYFIPENLKSDKELFRKASFVSAACLLMGAICIFTLIYAIFAIPDPIYISIGFAFLFCIFLSIFIFKRIGSFTFMALFLNGISFLALISSAMAT